MKKYLFFLSALSLSLFTACSSEEDIATDTGLTQAEIDAAIVEANQDSEVKIRLGLGSQSNSTSTTRAPLESDASKLFETPAGQYLGIFALAQTAQLGQNSTLKPGQSATGDIDWASTTDSKLYHLMALNQPARVKILRHIDDPADPNYPTYLGNVPLGDDVSEVQFLNPTNLTGDPVYQYYPYGNWYNYHFYGYYPRQTTGITIQKKKVTVDYTINGSQDIIYANARPTVGSVDEGFNAKYLRDLQDANGNNDLSHLPKLELKHRLAQLRFWVKCTSATYTTGGYGENNGDKLFQIQNLKLTKVPTKWTLTVADRDNPTSTYNVSTKEPDGSEGKLTPTSTTLTLDSIRVKHMKLDNSGAVDTSSDTDTFSIASPATTRIHIPHTTGNDQGKLLGYAMIPTTTMMTGLTITDRTDPTIPYLVFTIYHGAKKTGDNTDDGKGQVYTSEEMAIEVPSGGFVAGKVYNVVLNIPPPEEIHMHATLDTWEVVDTPIPVDVD